MSSPVLSIKSTPLPAIVLASPLPSVVWYSLTISNISLNCLENSGLSSIKSVMSLANLGLAKIRCSDLVLPFHTSGDARLVVPLAVAETKAFILLLPWWFINSSCILSITVLKTFSSASAGALIVAVPKLRVAVLIIETIPPLRMFSTLRHVLIALPCAKSIALCFCLAACPREPALRIWDSLLSILPASDPLPVTIST